MGEHVQYSGLVIAGVGFFLTRFTVTLAIYEDPLRFYLAGVVPLILGLGLAAFGVALTVADVDASLVRTTATWCVLGAAAMLVLVVLTLAGSSPNGVPDFGAARSQTYLSNFLIGGSVGGTLTGLYASRNRQQRTALNQRANRLVVLNQLLRDQVLNSLTAIRGYATVNTEDNPEAEAVIERHSDAIEDTVEEVRYLARPTERAASAAGAVAIGDSLAESVARVTERHPGVEVALDEVSDEVSVRANERLVWVFEELIDNAVVHGNDDEPVVEAVVTESEVAVTVSDDGPGLPASERATLESGDFETTEGPRTGLELGLNVVRLLVESYGGRIDTAVGPAGTSITVTLVRPTEADTDFRPNKSDLGRASPAVPHLVVAFTAAVVAGVAYGLVSEALGGSVAGIGVFYGATNTVVGWMTHEFHSVVFGFVFLSLVSLAPERYRESVLGYVAIATGWAFALWALAAGVVAPVWLRLLGVPAPIPNLSAPLLASHLVWGVSLGALTALGYRHVAPRLADAVEESTTAE